MVCYMYLEGWKICNMDIEIIMLVMFGGKSAITAHNLNVCLSLSDQEVCWLL